MSAVCCCRPARSRHAESWPVRSRSFVQPAPRTSAGSDPSRTAVARAAHDGCTLDLSGTRRMSRVAYRSCCHVTPAAITSPISTANCTDTRNLAHALSRRAARGVRAAYSPAGSLTERMPDMPLRATSPTRCRRALPRPVRDCSSIRTWRAYRRLRN